MRTAARQVDFVRSDVPLAVRIAQAVRADRQPSPAPKTQEKLHLCLLDFMSCALESRDLPWARQAAALAEGQGRATIIGTARRAFAGDAAYANAVAGHGLVREDMHSGAVSHLGVAVLPALLAVAEDRTISGATFAKAAVVGYEVGAKIGQAIVNPVFSRMFRPTGYTGPIAAAAALGTLLGLDEEEITSAIAFASNVTGGLNQWPHTGSDEMFFHPGHAAASGIRAARLAMSGARGAALALDGDAGLIRAYRPDRTVPDVALFDGPEPEIMSVYFKAAPVCNFAQTPCQAALALAREERLDPDSIAAVTLRVTEAAHVYPGCDHAGPFERVLQAKMSIQYSVASALLRGMIDESSYRSLDDPALMRLAGLIRMEPDDGLSAAYPAEQGAAITVTLKDGRELSRSLDDVVPASAGLIHERFTAAVTAFAGADRARQLEDAIGDLTKVADMGAVMRLLSKPA